MPRKLYIIISLIVLFPFFINAQILTVTPSEPTVNDSITIIYDASQGNAALSGYSGDVYMHTGVLTVQSTNSHDWKYVKTNWAENTPETKMISLGNDKYQASFNIKSFYGIPDNEIVTKLAFVFRSENSTLQGKTQDNGDIFYSLKFNYSNSLYYSYNLSNDSLIITCSDGKIIITPFSSNILNIFSAIQGQENEPSYSTIAQKENTTTYFSEINNFLKFSTDSIELWIDTNDLSFRFVYDNDTILNAPKLYNFQNSGILVSKLKNNERIYGTGSRAINMDRNGKLLQINNQAHYGYSFGAENLNITLPIIESSQKYCLYFDNHSIANMDIGASDPNLFTYTYNTGQADVFFIAGNNYNSFSKYLTQLTGHQPIPPIWALGYIQSKYGYENQTEATNIVNTIKSADFPLDALILDLYWFGTPSTMGNLNWDYSRFPNPTKMMSDFLNIGVKTILITETYFTTSSSNYLSASAYNYFAKDSSSQTYVLNGFWAGNAALLDVFNPNADNWFWQFYKNRMNEGVSGWWTDLGEPESYSSDMLHYNGLTASQIHNVYALQWEKIIYDNWQNDFPDKRLFNLSRSGFIGMQRYSTFPWSGDISRSFDGLRAQIPIMLSMGLCGIGYMHSDNGGFTGGGNDDELFTRWVQMGVFAPVFRIHGSGIETAPTAYGTSAKNISRKYIKLRYKLLPYNYTLAYENSEYGTPLARSMYFYDAQNTNLQNINDQYFWGDNFIIAPILYQGQTQRNVVLPKGKWIEYHTLNEYSGPGTFSIQAPIENIPILVKAGSFIPTVHNLYTTDNYNADKLFIQYFPDESISSSFYTLYDDDKKSPTSLSSSNFELINFTGNYSSNEITIDINSSGNGYIGRPLKRQFIFEIFRINKIPTIAEIDNTKISRYNSLTELQNQQSGFYLDKVNEKLYVNIPFSDISTQVYLSDFQVSNNEINKNTEQFSIFPNPGNDFFYIQTINNYNYSVSIFSTSGKLIKKLNNQSNNLLKINTTDLTNGIYIIKIQNSENIQTLKWIKK